jgi:surfeit locus 1 family protein
MSFKPSAISTTLFAGLALGFSGLGFWQLEKGSDKELRIQNFENAGQLNELPSSQIAEEFTHLKITGTFRPGLDTLADNQIHKGQPGVHVYTPFDVQDGQTILVNRGWLPLPVDRQTLPVVITPEEQLEISGKIGVMPVPGRQLGGEDNMKSNLWPQLVTYPKLEAISAALDTELYPFVLFLDESAASGFSGRKWKPVYMSPSKHRAYAFQWFALAVTAIGAWFFLGKRSSQT